MVQKSLYGWYGRDAHKTSDDYGVAEMDGVGTVDGRHMRIRMRVLFVRIMRALKVRILQPLRTEK